MTGHGSKRAQSEDAALAALLSEPTIEAAAGQAEISPATLYRWLADPVFKARYREARRQAVEHAVGPQAPFAPARVAAEEQREVAVGVDGLDDDPPAVKAAALQVGAGAAVVAVDRNPVGDAVQQFVHGRTIGASASCPAIAAASQCPVQ